MLFERIESAGLAHYSYIIGDQKEAVVIDPRRDIDAYLEVANKNGMAITNVLETHRNEDYIIGSKELADRTGAAIFHSDYDDFEYEYGTTIKDEDLIRFGNLKMKAIHTPGHTKGHMSYLLYDADQNPWVIFTGDVIFAGDVGRTDFYAGQNKEMTGKLYDSIFNKILPLGDGVIICPSHGAGSVCGSAITERIWTTIGLERKNSPALQYKNKQDFIEVHHQNLDYPPYFEEMERLNKTGAEIFGNVPHPTPLTASDFMDSIEDAQILDIRSEMCFGAGHIPNSIYIEKDMLSKFAGWLLNYESPIVLISDSNIPNQVFRELFRLGFDNIKGYLGGGMTTAVQAGIKTKSIPTIDAVSVNDKSSDFFILDVRGEEEVEEGDLDSDIRMKIYKLADNLDKIPRDKTICIFCGSGIRSMMAASILENAGYKNLTVALGGTSGLNVL